LFSSFIHKHKHKLKDESGSQHVTFVVVALRPNCECCDKDLPLVSVEAMTFSFECTFFRDCVMTIFSGICPNYFGDLVARPIRPEAALLKHPASQQRILKKHR